MMSALPLASARLSKLWILCLNDLLDGDLCKKIIYIFSLFFWFKHDFSDELMLPVSQFQTQQVVTSQIRSYVEYLTQTYYISCAHFIVKIYENSSHNGGFNTMYWWMMIVAYFFGPPCILVWNYTAWRQRQVRVSVLSQAVLDSAVVRLEPATSRSSLTSFH